MTDLDTAYPAAGDSPGLLLWQVTNKWQSAIRSALQPFELTHVQFVLLASLSWLSREGPVTQKRLADHAVTDPMMTSQVIRALERRGLVTRDVDPGDRRARAVQVTEQGAALANAAVVAVEHCDQQFFSRLGTGLPPFVAALGEL